MEPLEITITHNLDDKAEVSTLFERKWLALSWERKGADPKYYEGRGKRDVLLFHEMRQRGAAVVAAYKSATPKSPGARVVGIVLPDSPFEELNGMPCLSLANAQIYDASRSFLGNLVPRQCTVQNCGMRARGRLRNLAFGTQSVPSVYSLHHLDVEWLVTNYLIMTGICAAIWSGGRTYEHIDHVGLTLEGNELVAQTTISPNLVAEKAVQLSMYAGKDRVLYLFAPEGAMTVPSNVKHVSIESVFGWMHTEPRGRWLLDRMLSAGIPMQIRK